MYNNWLKVCDANKSLKDKIVEINEENADLKSALVNLKNLVKEKYEKIQEIIVDPEGKKKSKVVKFWNNKIGPNSEYGTIHVQSKWDRIF